LDVNVQNLRYRWIVFSKTVEYALRATVFLATRGHEPASTEEIAKATQVPSAFLAKILRQLGRKRIVRAQRGAGGGVRLARDPEALTILDVVNAVDPIQRIERCPLNLASHGKHLCPLHRRLDSALAEIERSFRNTTLAEVLKTPTTSIPLCEFPVQLKGKGRARP
jgi:Rrf2 family transcriptional regulator, nitric oxide-sensitive transcriptional repressor